MRPYVFRHGSPPVLLVAGFEVYLPQAWFTRLRRAATAAEKYLETHSALSATLPAIASLKTRYLFSAPKPLAQARRAGLRWGYFFAMLRFMSKD
jgi:hypothetical protein